MMAYRYGKISRRSFKPGLSAIARIYFPRQSLQLGLPLLHQRNPIVRPTVLALPRSAVSSRPPCRGQTITELRPEPL